MAQVENPDVIYSGISMNLPKPDTEIDLGKPTADPGRFKSSIITYGVHYDRTVTGPSVTLLNSTSKEDVVKATGCIYDDVRDYYKTNYEMGMLIFVMFVPVLSFLAFSGLITNTLSYIVLRKEGARAARTPDLILRVLSIADNFVLIAYVLFYTFPNIYAFTGSFVVYYEWFMYSKRYIWFLLWASKTFSVYTVVLLTIDRYVAVCKPLQATSFCTKRNAMLGISLVCGFSIVYNIPKIWYVETVFKLDNCTNTTKPYADYTVLYHNTIFNFVYVNILYLLVMFFIPLTLLIILNICLVRAVRKARRLQHRLTTQGQTRDNVTERVIAVVTTFIILEAPAVILNTILIIPKYISPSIKIGFNKHLLYAMRSTYIISAVNSCVNFYIYCLVGKRFRKLVLRILCPRKLKSEWLPMTSQTRSSLVTHYQPAANHKHENSV